MNDPAKDVAVIGSAYRGLPQEAPPPAIDSILLEAARASVAPPRQRKWAIPVSLAAVLVLSVAVTLRMGSERPDVATIESSVQSPGPTAEQLSPRAAPPKEAPAKPSEASRPAAREEKGSVPVPPPVVVPAPQPGPRAPAPVNQEVAKRQDRAKNEPATPKDDRTARVAPASTTSSAKASVATVPPPANESRQSQPAAPPSRSAQATPAAPAPSAPDALSSASSSADRQERSAVRTDQAPTAAKSEAADSGLAANSQRAPDEWLERIALLRAEGRNIEADVNLAEFRRIYPKFNITRDIREKVERRPSPPPIQSTNPKSREAP